MIRYLVAICQTNRLKNYMCFFGHITTSWETQNHKICKFIYIIKITGKFMFWGTLTLCYSAVPLAACIYLFLNLWQDPFQLPLGKTCGSSILFHTFPCFKAIMVNSLCITEVWLHVFTIPAVKKSEGLQKLRKIHPICVLFWLSFMKRKPLHVGLYLVP